MCLSPPLWRLINERVSKCVCRRLFERLTNERVFKSGLTINGEPLLYKGVTIKLQTEIITKANKVLKLYYNGMKKIVFPNIEKILNVLLEEENSLKEKFIKIKPK